MNPSSPILHSAADEQAALWAARLEGGLLSPDDQLALNAWLDEDPRHRALLSGYCQFSANLEEQLPALVAAGRASLPAENPRQPARRRWFSGLALAATAAAAAVTIAFWPATGGQQDIATSVAHRQALILADGTRITLNANTRLAVEHTATARRVRLASGEAFFAVAKDPSRPFFVDTQAGSVRVTGTEFNVRSELASQLEVTVTEGSVQVRADGANETFALAAGDRLTAKAGQVRTEKLAPAAIEDALAWRQGRVFVGGARLEVAAERLSRYHNRPIEVSSAAKDILVGGSPALDDLDGFLEYLSLPDGHRLAVTRQGANGPVTIGSPTPASR